MLKSRRGLVAAGLAVSVVGALGVASVVNANAAQIPVGPAPAAPYAATATPPALLPWGEKPTKIRTGRAGTSSDALRSAGLTAAAHTGGSNQPRGRHAPRSRPATRGPAAPEPASATASTAYFYNVGSQTAETDGFFANVTVAKPTLGENDNHTLAELAVQSADTEQIVEVGWTVDQQLNGDTDPHLFVYHWINGAETCYNACGFVQTSTTVKPGATLAAGSAKRFGIQYLSGNWWVAFDTEYIGYFPEKIWTAEGVSAFSRSGLIQIFGEVASTTDKPCSQMGNGLPGTDTAAALFGSVSFLNGPTVALNVWSSTDYYTVSALSARTLRYGGPGAC